jgi:hypothetical protein
MEDSVVAGVDPLPLILARADQAVLVVLPVVAYMVRDSQVPLQLLQQPMVAVGPELKHSQVEAVAAVNTGSTARPMQEVVVGVLLRTVLPVMQEMVSVDMCLSREFGNRINIRLCHIHYTTPIIQS